MLNVPKYLFIGALTGFVPFILIALNSWFLNKNIQKPSNVMFHVIFVFIYYAMTHLIVNMTLFPYLGNNKYYHLIIGAVIGFIYSSLGQFQYDLPKTFWKISERNIVMISIVQWMLIYHYVIRKLENKMLP